MSKLGSHKNLKYATLMSSYFVKQKQRDLNEKHVLFYSVIT